MSQPTPYSRSFSFTDFAADEPTTPPPGANIDAELDAIQLTAAAILANLVLIQRDDGALKNNSVGFDQLTTALLAMIEAAAGWAPRGIWVTATAYVIGDLTTHSTGTYVSAAAHTSGVFATDLAAGI